MSYGGEYRRMVAKLLARGGDREQALIQSVGGAFDAVGPLERAVVSKKASPRMGCWSM